MKRHLLLLGPLLFTAGCIATALATDPAGAEPGGMSVDDIVRLSPIGGLVWGAFILGRAADRGLKLSISVSVDGETKPLLERATTAMESIAVSLKVRDEATPTKG